MALGGEEVLGLQWDRHPNAAEMYYYEDWHTPLEEGRM